MQDGVLNRDCVITDSDEHSPSAVHLRGASEPIGKHIPNGQTGTLFKSENCSYEAVGIASPKVVMITAWDLQ